MKKAASIFFALICLISSRAVSQTSAMTITDTNAAKVIMGNYNPATYTASTIINDHDSISLGIHNWVSPDSLKAYIIALKNFYNRNSASDTVSTTRGIGAARRWAHTKFRQFSARNENRLLPCYLQFDINMCSVMRHRNVLAVLPGRDTSDRSVIVIEGHMDSRNADNCDTAIVAQGVEDNASGAALVVELARVMSRYSFNHTIVFMLTTGEEQGLFGGEAFARYASLHGVQIKAVLNNDVVGGIYCGHTASPPGCTGFGDVDSTHVRLFSFGGFNSPQKGLCRYMKLEYNESIRPVSTVPMGINIMTPEDRTGRGGDHIPFRTFNFTSMRLTAANENGNGNVADTSYSDRQHTLRDSIGIDADHNGTIDTYFVDFSYLARNTVINGNAAGMAGISPFTPDFTLSTTGNNLIINITAHPEYLHYKVGVRTTTNDWDSVYEFSGTLIDTIIVGPGNYIVSVASVDGHGVESLFSRELMVSTHVQNTEYAKEQVELLQNKPNPADEATAISVVVRGNVQYKDALIEITDLQGKIVEKQTVSLNVGVNEIVFEHGYHAAGTYIYSLVIDGRHVQSRKMVFAN